MMWLHPEGPAIIAHRGASATHTENTLEAFVAARSLGADAVELDVRRSADGHLIVIHDATYPDGRAVAHTPAAERPAHVPSLADAFDAAKPCWVNVEIKNLPHEPGYDPDEAVAIDTARWLEDGPSSVTVLVSSFTPPTLSAVRQTAPRLDTALLLFATGDVGATVAEAASAGHAAIHPFDPMVDIALIDAAHNAGLAVNVWTVDAPDRIRELADLGVDGIVTNMPDVAARALGRR
jgi:glycerophosphoryl diester phosphodiesterase